MVYHYCIVPECISTTKSTPGKAFVKVPLNQEKRKLWLKATGRNYTDISAKSNIFVCEDHFDLETDMENFTEWKMMGVQKRMRPNVVPHKFESQEDGKQTADRPSTSKMSNVGVSVAVQVNLRPKYRSKSTQCNVSTATVRPSCIALSPIKLDAATKKLPESTLSK